MKAIVAVTMATRTRIQGLNVLLLDDVAGGENVPPARPRGGTGETEGGGGAAAVGHGFANGRPHNCVL